MNWTCANMLSVIWDFLIVLRRCVVRPVRPQKAAKEMFTKPFPQFRPRVISINGAGFPVENPA